eukprot:UC1_evm1s451
MHSARGHLSTQALRVWFWFLILAPLLVQRGSLCAMLKGGDNGGGADTAAANNRIIVPPRSPPPYSHERFAFRRKSRSARLLRTRMRECEVACEKRIEAYALWPEHAKTSCARHCASPTCYKALYATDPLERGEVDVRKRAFMGCAAVEIKDREAERQRQIARQEYLTSTG